MRRLPEPPLALVVFTVGLSILGAEIAAARLLAPYFGASTIVWANTIGIVLVALSIGYWYGGRLADRDPTRAGLYRIVLVSGLLLAAVPFAADPLLGFAVDALDSISAGAFVGSLLAVTALVAIPILVSGAVAPYALRLAVADVEHAGTVSGRLYAISTVGSLLGTFSSALLFIPLIGTRRTFLVFGLALVAIAAVGLARKRYALAPLALAALLALPVGTVKGETAAGAMVIHETDTEYQYARVVQDADGTRTLELNEGQAVHSVRRPGSYLTGDYWDEMLVLPFATTGRAPASIAILGNAAGTTARAYGHFFPRTRIDAVEIDAELTGIGRRYFDMRGPRLHTHAADARPYLRRTSRRYDAIVVDAYRQPYIPFYLATREFFELARERLRPGGTLLVNVGHPERSDRLEQVAGATVIHETDTEYQYARVVQAADGTRTLELNEGQAVHSVRRPGSYLTGDYWDEMLVLPFATTGRAPASIAILGNAAGTTARAYGHFFPRTRIDAVEIDAELTGIGRRYFDMRGPRLHTHAADARPYLRRTSRRYDAIVVDAYRQPYIPFYLATREFFELARERLRPGGTLLVNVGHPQRSDRLEQVLGATVASAFGIVLRDASQPTNTVLLATAGAASGERLAASAATMPALLRPVARAAAARLAPRLRGGRVYTDDVAPVEWLVDTSILQVAAEGER